MDVNIYIDTTIKAPNRGHGGAMYIIEAIVKGEPKTIDGFIDLPDTTEDAITLTAMIEAYQRFTKPAKIKVFTKCNGVYYGIETGRITTAIAEGYKTAKGKPIKNAELWDIYVKLAVKHQNSITQEDHSYMEYMKQGLKKWNNQ